MLRKGGETLLTMFWQTFTGCSDIRMRQHTRSKQFAPKWRHLIKIFFCRGQQVELSLSRWLLPQKTHNLPLALRTCEKNWTRLVGVYISKNISQFNQVKQNTTLPPQVDRFLFLPLPSATHLRSSVIVTWILFITNSLRSLYFKLFSWR